MIPHSIYNKLVGEAPCDIGAIISLMPFQAYRDPSLGKVKITSLQQANSSSHGTIEYVLEWLIYFIDHDED